MYQEGVADEEKHVVFFEQWEPRELDATAGRYYWMFSVKIECWILIGRKIFIVLVRIICSLRGIGRTR